MAVALEENIGRFIKIFPRALSKRQIKPLVPILKKSASDPPFGVSCILFSADNELLLTELLLSESICPLSQAAQTRWAVLYPINIFIFLASHP